MGLGGSVSRCLAFCLLAAGLCACARASGPPPREARLARWAGAHVYHRPAPEIAAAVRAELGAEGYIMLADEQDGLLRTEWKFLIDGVEFATVRDRYIVLVKRLTAHHCRVEALRIDLSTLGSDTAIQYHMMMPPGISDRYVSTVLYGVGPTRAAVPRAYARDLAFEWRLLRRVDPGSAHRLEASL